MLYLSFCFSVLNVHVASLLQNFEGFFSIRCHVEVAEQPTQRCELIHFALHSRTGLGMKIMKRQTDPHGKVMTGSKQKNKTKKYILLITSSSPYRKEQFAVSYFSASLIVLIQDVYWEIRHHSLLCCCGLADILYISV